MGDDQDPGEGWPVVIRVGLESEGAFGMRWLADESTRPGDRFLVDVEGDEIVGTIRFRENRESRLSHPGWYYATSVHPSWRGDGRAKRLIEACAETLRSEGVSVLYTAVARPEAI